MKTKLRLISAALLPIQIVVVSYLAQHPGLTEAYYSHGIFPIVGKIERFLFGWLPFSVGDLLYLVFGFILIYWVIRRFKTRFRHPKRWGLQLVSAASVLYFCFHFFWGLNYYRLPLYQSLQLDPQYSHQELVDFTKQLIKKTNLLQAQLTANDSLKVNFPLSDKTIDSLAIVGYRQLAQTYPHLRYRLKSIKSSLFSLPLTYMGFSGYINPLTNEAQVNSKVPPFRLITVTAHEMAHQLGFAKENEANFIACLNTMNHHNPYFRYSGYTFALQYCLNEVYIENPTQGKKLRRTLHPGVLKNFRDLRQFWRAYQNPLEPFFKLFYGQYLKANNQPKGIQSYNYVVALLVNYYQDTHHQL